MGSKLEPHKDEIIRLYQQGISTVKLSNLFQSPANNIMLALNKWGISTSRVYRTYIPKFDQWPLTPDGSYWLGFLLADGYINPNRADKISVELSSNDRDHLVKLAQFALHNYRVTDKVNRISPEHQTATLYICNKAIIKSLDDLGWHEFKNGLDPTRLISKIDKPILHHLIRGFFDGDGSIGHREFSLVSPHESVMEIVAQIINAAAGTNLMVRPNGLNRRSNGKYKDLYRIRTTHRIHIQQLYEYLYSPDCVFLPRKHEKFRNRLEK